MQGEGHVAGAVLPYPGSRGGLNHRVVVPEVLTDDMWDETICDLPAMKSLNKTYAELREAARLGNVKIRVYFNFIMAKFGASNRLSQVVRPNRKALILGMASQEFLGCVRIASNNNLHPKVEKRCSCAGERNYGCQVKRDAKVQGQWKGQMIALWVVS